LLIDATDSDYVDPDILSLIRDFQNETAPARGINVSLKGFREKYKLCDEIQFADYSTRELQDRVTPEQVLEILREGNRRFRTGNRLTRDFNLQIDATAEQQNPLAAVLSCIDSRVPAELIFDLGIGDMFSVRVAGNVVGTKTLGSLEYAANVAGVKLIVVMGHTRCSAVTSLVQLLGQKQDVSQATGCPHLPSIVSEIEPCLRPEELESLGEMHHEAREHFVDEIAKRNVVRTAHEIISRSKPIAEAVDAGRVMVVGALYDVRSGIVEFLPEHALAEESRIA
jgi:carbonic anhydrase/SulP family sulfate permease